MEQFTKSTPDNEKVHGWADSISISISSPLEFACPFFGVTQHAIHISINLDTI